MVADGAHETRARDQNSVRFVQSGNRDLLKLTKVGQRVSYIKLYFHPTGANLIRKYLHRQIETQ